MGTGRGKRYERSSRRCRGESLDSVARDVFTKEQDGTLAYEGDRPVKK